MTIADILKQHPKNKFAPYQRMALVIVDLTREQGVCDPQDLVQCGFSPQEAFNRWHMAHAMASVELKLMEV